jgi:hypothetical protein
MSEQYKQAIAELENFYGGNILNGGILEATWISEMQKLSIQQLQVAIARCFKKHPRKYNYFPSPDEILELGRGSLPVENSQAYTTPDLSKPALPASYEGISPEEAEATQREILIARLFLLSKGSLPEEETKIFHQKMRNFPAHELEAMILNAKPSVLYRKNFLSAHDAALKYFENLASRTTK